MIIVSTTKIPDSPVRSAAFVPVPQRRSRQIDHSLAARRELVVGHALRSNRLIGTDRGVTAKVSRR